MKAEDVRYAHRGGRDESLRDGRYIRTGRQELREERDIFFTYRSPNTSHC
jgi:hypothetical protein